MPAGVDKFLTRFMPTGHLFDRAVCGKPIWDPAVTHYREFDNFEMHQTTYGGSQMTVSERKGTGIAVIDGWLVIDAAAICYKFKISIVESHRILIQKKQSNPSAQNPEPKSAYFVKTAYKPDYNQNCFADMLLRSAPQYMLGGNMTGFAAPCKILSMVLSARTFINSRWPWHNRQWSPSAFPPQTLR